MSTKTTVWADCRECCRSTSHQVLAEEIYETDPREYHQRDTWQIVRCQGCLTYGFRHRYDDFEAAMEDDDGVTVNDYTVKQYPSVLADHRSLQQTWDLPALIRKVYQETLKALSNDSKVLASVGLRATIEAVCNHLKVSGTNLERRIDQLFKAGHISNGDKRRLHAIRFLGNDAAHEIKEPQAADIRVALDIVEHLLNSVFILETKARNLDTVAENYDDFKRILVSAAAAFTGSAASAAAILGRKRRLVTQAFEDFESKLKAEVQSGALPYLKLGPTTKLNGKDVQLYEVDTMQAQLLDDSIPF